MGAAGAVAVVSALLSLLDAVVVVADEEEDPVDAEPTLLEVEQVPVQLELGGVRAAGGSAGAAAAVGLLGMATMSISGKASSLQFFGRHTSKARRSMRATNTARMGLGGAVPPWLRADSSESNSASSYSSPKKLVGLSEITGKRCWSGFSAFREKVIHNFYCIYYIKLVQHLSSVIS